MGPGVAASGGGAGRHSQRGKRDWLVRDQCGWVRDSELESGNTEASAEL